MQQEQAEPIQRQLNIFQSLTFMLAMSYVFISDVACFMVGATSVYYGDCSAANAVVAAFTATFVGM